MRKMAPYSGAIFLTSGKFVWSCADQGKTIERHVHQDGGAGKSGIPRSRHDPKILGIDDAEIVGDRITEVRPIPRNFFTQETERRIGELGASRVGFIVRDMLVHHAP